MAMPLSALMLLDSLALPPGAWIVQNAANGAVGKALAMLGEARGLHVVNVVRRDEGIAELAALGIPPRGVQRAARLDAAGARPHRPGTGAGGDRLGRRQGQRRDAVAGRQRRHPGVVRRTDRRGDAALAGRPDLQAGDREGLLGQQGQPGDVHRGQATPRRRAAATHAGRRAACRWTRSTTSPTSARQRPRATTRARRQVLLRPEATVQACSSASARRSTAITSRPL